MEIVDNTPTQRFSVIIQKSAKKWLKVLSGPAHCQSLHRWSMENDGHLINWKRVMLIKTCFWEIFLSRMQKWETCLRHSDGIHSKSSDLKNWKIEGELKKHPVDVLLCARNRYRVILNLPALWRGSPANWISFVYQTVTIYRKMTVKDSWD